MGIEYELKFRANPEIIKKISADYPEKQQHYTMVTTYYDTPSGAFSARKCTLRCRMENEAAVCTLKTPAGMLGRNEYEVSCDTIQNAIPQFLVQGAPVEYGDLAQEGLKPVCGAQFHRIAISVTYGDCRLELALDEGLLSGGGKELPLCEVEVELKDGPAEGADLFALELANAYGLTTETKSKFKRAMELYKGDR